MIEIETYPGKFEEVTSTKESTGKYNPKALVVMVDEMTEVTEGSNYKLVNSIKTSIESIGRLGRAAACHLVLATQRPSGNVISNDLKNNIQQSVLLGEFDASASSLLFDEDMSHRAKPEIKGRGLVKSGNNVIEFQSYWTEPDKDFRYKEENEETIFKSIEKISTKPELEEIIDKENIFNLEIPLDIEDGIFGDEDKDNIDEICRDIQEKRIIFPKNIKKLKLKIKKKKSKKLSVKIKK